jgi:hypothetical protein
VRSAPVFFCSAYCIIFVVHPTYCTFSSVLIFSEWIFHILTHVCGLVRNFTSLVYKLLTSSLQVSHNKLVNELQKKHQSVGLLEYVKDEYRVKNGRETDVADWKLVSCTRGTPKQRNGG